MWFDIDKLGLRQVFLKIYLLRELIANMWDEIPNGAHTGRIKITRNQDGVYHVMVDDDSPDGFKELTDSFTLFR